MPWLAIFEQFYYTILSPFSQNVFRSSSKKPSTFPFCNAKIGEKALRETVWTGIFRRHFRFGMCWMPFTKHKSCPGTHQYRGFEKKVGKNEKTQLAPLLYPESVKEKSVKVLSKYEADKKMDQYIVENGKAQPQHMRRFLRIEGQPQSAKPVLGGGRNEFLQNMNDELNRTAKIDRIHKILLVKSGKFGTGA